MTTESIVSIVLSVITAVTAVAAIVISITQISKSNKQSMFDRRIKIFLTVIGMKSLCEEHSSICEAYINDSKEGPLYAVDSLYLWMTNSSFLEEIQPVISHALETEWRRKYLLKMEELRNMCEETRLIFPDSMGRSLADFILSYEEMLVSIYKYQVAKNSISRECQDAKKPFPRDSELENRCRSVLIESIKNTLKLAEKLATEGALEKIKSQIKL